MNIANLLKQANTIVEESGESAGSSREPIPVKSVIVVRIESAEPKDTAAGGSMITVRFEVQGGQWAGRPIYHNINIIHPTKPKVGANGLADYERLCQAAGFPGQVEDLRQLVGKLVEAEVVKHDSYNGYINEAVGRWSAAPAHQIKVAQQLDDEIPF